MGKHYGPIKRIVCFVVFRVVELGPIGGIKPLKHKWFSYTLCFTWRFWKIHACPYPTG